MSNNVHPWSFRTLWRFGTTAFLCLPDQQHTNVSQQYTDIAEQLTLLSPFANLMAQLVLQLHDILACTIITVLLAQQQFHRLNVTGINKYGQQTDYKYTDLGLD